MPRVLNRFGYCHVGARCNGISYFDPCIFIVLTAFIVLLAFIVPTVVAVTTTRRPRLPPSTERASAPLVVFASPSLPRASPAACV